MRTMKTFAALVALAALGISALGCHATAGLGRDMERGGRKITHEAREHM
jgi:predicted small secreted protein